MPFDFTLLKDVPTISDAANAKYALVVSETSNSQNSIKKQAVEKLDTNLLKSDYIDATNDFIQNNDETDSASVLNYITSTLKPIISSGQCVAKNYYISLDPDYYFIKTFGPIDGICHIVQRYNKIDGAITEYKYNGTDLISEIHYTPNKLLIDTFTEFSNGLGVHNLAIDRLEFNAPTIGTVCLSSSNTQSALDPIINLSLLNTEGSTISNLVRVNGISNPINDADAVNKKYVDDLYNKLNSNEFDSLTANSIITGHVSFKNYAEFYYNNEASVAVKSPAYGKLLVEDQDGGPVSITNVRAGSGDSDVVNFGQLKSYLAEELNDFYNNFDPEVSLNWSDIVGKPDIFIYDSEHGTWSIGLEHIYDFPTYIGQDFIQTPYVVGGTITGAELIGGSLTIDASLYPVVKDDTPYNADDYFYINAEGKRIAPGIYVKDKTGRDTFKVDSNGDVSITGRVQIVGEGSSINWDSLTMAGQSPWDNDVSGLSSAVDDLRSLVGSAKASVFYCTCSTAASTSNKKIILNSSSNFPVTENTPLTGTCICVKFTYANKSNNTTLQIDGVTNAFMIKAGGSPLTAQSVYNWVNGTDVTFVFDGTNWVMIGSSLGSIIGSWCAENNITLINGARIATGTIDANSIKTNSITAKQIQSGAITANMISTGTLNADNISLGANDCGYFKKYQGNNGIGDTVGIKMESPVDRYYVAVSNRGVKLNADDSEFYITSSDGKFNVSNDNFHMGVHVPDTVYDKPTNTTTGKTELYSTYKNNDGLDRSKSSIQVITHKYGESTEPSILLKSWLYNSSGGTDSHMLISSSGIWSSKAISTSSDANLKKDISYDISSYKAAYKELKPASFLYLNQDNNKKHIGFIAQDVEEAFNNQGIDINSTGIVSKLNNEYSLAYSELIALNTAIIQDLMNDIEKLNKRLQELESNN